MVKLCPSARCKTGNTIFGMLTDKGSVAFLRDKLTATESFVEATKNGSKPESRFRFSDKCYESACEKWNGQNCSVAKIAAELSISDVRLLEESVPSCAIREHCRWFYERGDSACKACRWLITERN